MKYPASVVQIHLARPFPSVRDVSARSTPHVPVRDHFQPDGVETGRMFPLGITNIGASRTRWTGVTVNHDMAGSIPAASANDAEIEMKDDDRQRGYSGVG